jgi:hypothetical protein
LLALLRMEGVPRPNTLADLARRFRRRDIHRLAECGLPSGPIRASGGSTRFWGCCGAAG